MTNYVDGDDYTYEPPMPEKGEIIKTISNACQVLVGHMAILNWVGLSGDQKRTFVSRIQSYSKEIEALKNELHNNPQAYDMEWISVHIHHALQRLSKMIEDIPTTR